MFMYLSGCNNTRITVDHAIGSSVYRYSLKEWDMYVKQFPSRPKKLRNTFGWWNAYIFLAVIIWKNWIHGLLKTQMSQLTMNLDWSHPNYTQVEQLPNTLWSWFQKSEFRDSGFWSESSIHHSSHSNLWAGETCHQAAKENWIWVCQLRPWVYGLPFANYGHDHWYNWKKVKVLMPDRIAFYSYAHVPLDQTRTKTIHRRWFTRRRRENVPCMKRSFDAWRIPDTKKSEWIIFLPSDSLYKAFVTWKNCTGILWDIRPPIHLLIRLGVSSIGDSWTGFCAECESIRRYVKMVNEGKLPIVRGHILSEEDLVIRRHILNLMCHFETSWENPEDQTEAL